jgi:thymidylate kinase
VAEAYEQLATAEPLRFVRLDASGSREKIHLEVRNFITPLLEKVG